ncbi:MAG: hypothetical protein SFZ02_13075, partial [bacterium]|nr:hypothetical protein [bacterium]
METIANTALANINRQYDWSDNAYLMAIWSSAIPDYAAYTGYYPQGNLNQLIISNIDTGNSVVSQGIFDAIQQNLVWSPDSRAVAFLGKQRINRLEEYDFLSQPQPYSLDLILISTTTGESTVIDTNVTEIITWRSICDFTVSDSASLISTMQTEPYSVICLDENGQYDLTAPLPNVAGDITIIGNGASITMTGGAQIFNVAGTGGLTLKNITVSGGNAVQGGAIFNAGTL